LIVAANSELPPAMRVLLPNAARLHAATARLASTDGSRRTVLAPPRPPRILYPVPNSTLEVSATSGERAVSLKAEGGSGALRWLVNGKPLPVDPFRADPLWRPEAAGLARLTVIDSTGHSSTIEIRITLAER
jgi:membrane carboxypeptidase/penicillin-binding protein PbpC